LEKWILRGREQLGAGQVAIMENINFHLRLAEVTKNPILCIALSSIMSLLVIFLRALPVNCRVSQQITKEHYEILSALESKNEKLLLELMQSHIRAINLRLSQLKKEDDNVLFCIMKG